MKRLARAEPMRGSRLPLVLTCLASLLPSRAGAEEHRGRTSSLSWVRGAGAESCLPTQELARMVEAKLGRPVFVSASQGDVSVEGVIEKKNDAFHAAFTLRDAHGASLGTREISRPGPSCDGMRQPLALVVALMIDPDAALGDAPAPPAPPAPGPQEPAAPVIVEKPVYVPVPPPPPAPTWTLDAGGSFAITAGLLPAPGLGFGAGALIQPPGFFPFEAMGTVWIDDTARSGSGSVNLSLLQGAAGLCPLHFDGSRVRAYGCARGELGLWIGRYAGASSRTENDAYVGASLEGRVTVRILGPFTARAGAAFVVPFLRPSFSEAQPAGATLFEPAVVGFTGDVGLGLLFP